MMLPKRKRKLQVKGTEISVKEIGGEDYISLTDMVQIKDGTFFVKSWLRNRNTVEFLGIWESLNNPDFNWHEFDLIRRRAGLNNFNLSVKEWTEKTNAIGLRAVAGRYGGTFAHKDIAFEFGMWISPAFKLYLVKDYDRLKAAENNKLQLEWDVRRVLASTTYSVQTDAVKDYLVPQALPWNKKYQYANEADLINLAIFGMTASEWRTANPTRAKHGENIRDMASINELLIMEELQLHNAQYIEKGLDKETRFNKLRQEAEVKRIALAKIDPAKNLKRLDGNTYLEAGDKQ